MNQALLPAITVDGHDTVASLFRARTRELGDKIALREKDLGIWKSVSWRDYGEYAKHVGLGLISLGLERGDVVAVLSENTKEWLFADLGTICAGGVTSGVYTTDSAKQLAYLVNDSQTKFLFVEDEEQLDKFLETRDDMPTLKKVFVFDMKGLRDFDDPMVAPVEELYALGEAYAAEHPDRWDAEIAKAKPDDTAVLIYTSGTTGPPKGAMITHRNIIFQVENGERINPINESDEQLSFLPLCHIAERTFTTFWPLKSRTTINLAESAETVLADIQEVAPTIFFAVPRIWEKFYSGIMIRLDDATFIGRLGYRLAIGDRGQAGGTPHGGQAPAVDDRSGVLARRPPGAPQHQDAARPSSPPLGHDGGGADLARSHQVVSGRSASGSTKSTARPRTAASRPPTTASISRSAPSAFRRPTPRCASPRRARS